MIRTPYQSKRKPSSAPYSSFGRVNTRNILRVGSARKDIPILQQQKRMIDQPRSWRNFFVQQKRMWMYIFSLIISILVATPSTLRRIVTVSAFAIPITVKRSVEIIIATATSPIKIRARRRRSWSLQLSPYEEYMNARQKEQEQQHSSTPFTAVSAAVASPFTSPTTPALSPTFPSNIPGNNNNNNCNHNAINAPASDEYHEVRYNNMPHKTGDSVALASSSTDSNNHISSNYQNQYKNLHCNPTSFNAETRFNTMPHRYDDTSTMHSSTTHEINLSDNNKVVPQPQFHINTGMYRNMPATDIPPRASWMTSSSTAPFQRNHVVPPTINTNSVTGSGDSAGQQQQPFPSNGYTTTMSSSSNIASISVETSSMSSSREYNNHKSRSDHPADDSSPASGTYGSVAHAMVSTSNGVSPPLSMTPSVEANNDKRNTLYRDSGDGADVSANIMNSCTSEPQNLSQHTAENLSVPSTIAQQTTKSTLWDEYYSKQTTNNNAWNMNHDRQTPIDVVHTSRNETPYPVDSMNHESVSIPDSSPSPATYESVPHAMIPILNGSSLPLARSPSVETNNDKGNTLHRVFANVMNSCTSEPPDIPQRTAENLSEPHHVAQQPTKPSLWDEYYSKQTTNNNAWNMNHDRQTPIDVAQTSQNKTPYPVDSMTHESVSIPDSSPSPAAYGSVPHAMVPILNGSSLPLAMSPSVKTNNDKGNTLHRVFANVMNSCTSEPPDIPQRTAENLSEPHPVAQQPTKPSLWDEYYSEQTTNNNAWRQNHDRQTPIDVVQPNQHMIQYPVDGVTHASVSIPNSSPASATYGSVPHAMASTSKGVSLPLLMTPSVETNNDDRKTFYRDSGHGADVSANIMNSCTSEPPDLPQHTAENLSVPSPVAQQPTKSSLCDEYYPKQTTNNNAWNQNHDRQPPIDAVQSSQSTLPYPDDGMTHASVSMPESSDTEREEITKNHKPIRHDATTTTTQSLGNWEANKAIDNNSNPQYRPSFFVPLHCRITHHDAASTTMEVKYSDEIDVKKGNEVTSLPKFQLNDGVYRPLSPSDAAAAPPSISPILSYVPPTGAPLCGEPPPFLSNGNTATINESSSAFRDYNNMCPLSRNQSIQELPSLSTTGTNASPPSDVAPISMNTWAQKPTEFPHIAVENRTEHSSTSATTMTQWDECYPKETTENNAWNQNHDRQTPNDIEQPSQNEFLNPVVDVTLKSTHMTDEPDTEREQMTTSKESLRNSESDSITSDSGSTTTRKVNEPINYFSNPQDRLSSFVPHHICVTQQDATSAADLTGRDKIIQNHNLEALSQPPFTTTTTTSTFLQGCAPSDDITSNNIGDSVGQLPQTSSNNESIQQPSVSLCRHEGVSILDTNTGDVKKNEQGNHQWTVGSIGAGSEPQAVDSKSLSSNELVTINEEDKTHFTQFSDQRNELAESMLVKSNMAILGNSEAVSFNGSVTSTSQNEIGKTIEVIHADALTKKRFGQTMPSIPEPTPRVITGKIHQEVDDVLIESNHKKKELFHNTKKGVISALKNRPNSVSNALKVFYDGDILDTRGMTERIMKRIDDVKQKPVPAVSHPLAATSCSSATYSALKKLEDDWTRVKQNSLSLSSKSIPKSLLSALPSKPFVTSDAVLGNEKCWAKLRKQAGEESLDYDIIICGGSLAIFLALSLLIRDPSYRISVINSVSMTSFLDNEWHASHSEIKELTQIGIIGEDEVNDIVTNEIPTGRFGYHVRA
jgi:hypothetical protein